MTPIHIAWKPDDLSVKTLPARVAKALAALLAHYGRTEAAPPFVLSTKPLDAELGRFHAEQKILGSDCAADLLVFKSGAVRLNIALRGPAALVAYRVKQAALQHLKEHLGGEEIEGP